MKRTAFALLSTLAVSGAALAQDVVKIGVPAIQSGPMATYGANFNNGVTVAVNQINQEGGLTIGGKKHKVQAVFCDTQADSAKAAACGRRLASQDKVAAMVMATSIETFPILGFNTSNPPFLVVSSSASNKLVEANNPLVARYWFNTYSYMPGLTSRFSEVFKTEGRTSSKISVMQSEDEFGKAWTDTFTAGWKKVGGEVASVSTWTLGTTDFYPQLSSLLRGKPDLIAIPGTCSTIAPIIKQGRELGFKGDFIVDLACDHVELAKFVKPEQFRGSYFLGSNWNLDSAENKSFKEGYAKVSKSGEPTVISADGYGQLMWVAKAMEKAGTATDAKAIRAALPEVMNGSWNLLGVTNLQANGETVASVFPRKIDASGNIVNYNK